MALAFLLSAVLFVLAVAALSPEGHPRDELLEAGFDWTAALAQTAERLGAWLGAHRLFAEAILFDRLAERVSASALALGAFKPAADLNLAQSVIVSLMFGFLRVSFVAVSALRPALLLVIVAAVWAHLQRRPHRGVDLLGQTGNDRVFFSGIQVGLAPTDINGAPATQVIGLACPKRAPRFKVVRTEIADSLRAFDALNDINLELLSVILAAEAMPGFVVPAGEEHRLDSTCPHASLRAVTHATLRAALRAHAAPHTITTRLAPTTPDPAVETEDMEQRLHSVFCRVLTTAAKHDLLTFSSAQIATTILALQAGKVLHHALEGGSWQQKSRFPQLSARAVLHSLPTFAQDYSFSQRAAIRQAIIYGQRRSLFAPVKLPAEMPGPTHALRQWIECLLATPQELLRTAEEVELFGLVREHELRFRTALTEMLQRPDHKSRANCFTTGATVFLPAQLLCSLARDVLPHEQSLRIAMLAKRSAIPPRETDQPLSTPIVTNQTRKLSTDHGLSLEDAFSWSGLRTVLTSHGWLARRVGDYSVPDQAVIFAIFVTSRTRHGFPGMVALRASRFEELLGPRWAASFTPVGRASMAETRPDYERRLKSDDPVAPLEEGAHG